jgi:hypothetical protein
MSRIVPDGFLKVHIVDSIASLSAPTIGEIAAGTETTPFLTPAGIDTPEEGTDADISNLSSARDQSIPATIGGELTGEYYRDDAADDAWDNQARLTITNVVIARFGGSGTDNAIVATDVVEVYPVRISQRSPSRAVRGEAMRFVVNYALSGDPDLVAVVAA